MQLAEDAGVTGDGRRPSRPTSSRSWCRRATPPASSRSTTSPTPRGCGASDEVPCGKVALAVLDANGVTAEPVSLEEDVRATLDKVVSGEADAGLVYATDAVAAADDVDAVEIPGAEDELDLLLRRDAGAVRGRRPRRRLGRVGDVGRRGRRSSGTPASAAREGPARAAAGAADGARRSSPRCSCSSRSWRWSRAPTGRHCRSTSRRAPRCDALRLSPGHLHGGHRVLPRCSGCPSPGCWHASTSAAAAPCARWSLVPLVLPPVVAGVALRSAFGRTGVIGEPLLAWTGFAFPFTTYGVVLAHVFVSLPFVRDRHRGRAALHRREVRRGCRDARRDPLDDVPPGHRPARPARACVAGSGPRLGAVARRVRRDHHLQRQLPRHHPDDADADLRRPASPTRTPPSP